MNGKVSELNLCVISTGESADTYRSITYKLIRHFGSRVVILAQSIGSEFICASDIHLGDALDMLRRLENEYNVDPHQSTV